METIFWEELSGDSCVSVEETTDSGYAHDCFDGTAHEWQEVYAEAEANREGIDKPLKFYIVSSGLQGCYMRDNVSVFGNKQDALKSAQWWIEQNEEFTEEEESI